MWRKCKKEWKNTKISEKLLFIIIFFSGVHKKNRVVQRRCSRKQVFLIKALMTELWVHFNSTAITSHFLLEVLWGWQVDKTTQRGREKHMYGDSWDTMGPRMTQLSISVFLVGIKCGLHDRTECAWLMLDYARFLLTVAIMNLCPVWLFKAFKS